MVLTQLEFQGWRNISAEFDTGVEMPWFDLTYELKPHYTVLVIEKLNPISHRDSIYRMLRDITRQLLVVHTSSAGPYVHSDLKLDNIHPFGNDDTK